jgi:MFS family permease
MTTTATPDTSAHSSRNKTLLLVISCLAYATIGFHFSIRTSIAGDLETLFAATDPVHAAELVGSALGIAFLGYGITILIISPLIDALGMGWLMKLSGALIAIGSVVVLMADQVDPDRLYAVVWTGTLLVGLGWGLVDTNTNPLVAGLYPQDRTHKLNVIHAWWPAGIVLGGLAGLALGEMDATWQTKLTVAIVPAVALAAMCFMVKFPLTERAAAGVSFGEMFREILRRPMFFVWFFCIWITATAELAPGQWVDMALTRTVGMRGIWLLIYISGLMFVMRHFAGTLAHKFSPVGLLWISCFLASIGLWWLSEANSPLTGMLAATLWGTGVCFMWPTILATVNDRYPRAGALGLGLMGFGAMLAIYLFLPIMGRVYDDTKIETAGGDDAFKALEGEELEAVLATASQASFQAVAVLPALLLAVFGVIWIYDKMKGVQIEMLGAEDEGQ